MDQLGVRLTVNHLRLAVAISDESSLVGAAKRLNMTQPAVTKALQAAEFQLNVKLFNRTSTGMVPTIYGEALVAQARIILSQLGHATQEINDLRDGTGGRIAIGTLLTASAVLLPTAIARLREQRPKLVMTVREGTNDLLMPALHSGDLDLVVGRLSEFRERADLVREVLQHDIACVVVRPNHPLIGRNDLTMRDLTSKQWILPPPETTLRRQIDKAFQDENFDPPLPAVESVSLLLNRTLLLLTDYLSVWPWQVACRDASLGQVGILPIVLPSTAGPIGITTRLDSRLSPAAEAFVETLQSVASEMELSPLLNGVPNTV